MNESVYLLRANPALSTNIKLVVDSQYNLYFESYSANQELSDQKYKKFQINSTSFLSERMAYFYKDLPADTAFTVKNDIQSDTIQNDYNMQYDDIYYSGARNVEDVRYKEEFQYNTTLKINAKHLPKWFFIFRVDGAGDVGITNSFNLNTLEPQPVSDILYNFKMVQSFDLSSNTEIGKLFQKNYIDDDILPRTCFELNLKHFEFSKWNGYNYKTGGTVSKSFFLNDYMQNESTHFETESFITDGFKKNEVIAANYLNLSFLFDDTVSGIFYPGITYNIKDYKFITDYIEQKIIKLTDITSGPDIDGDIIFNVNIPYRKKWTINRYYGFYLKDLQFIDKVSPVIPAALKNDPLIEIVNNNFMIGLIPVDPTVNGWNSDKVYYIKIEKDFYVIEKTSTGNFTIVSNTQKNKIINANLVDILENQQQPVKLKYMLGGDGLYHSYLMNLDDTYYVNNSINYYFNYEFYQVVLIKIFGKFYTLKRESLHYYINTDEYITCDSISFNRQLGLNTKETISTNPVSKDETIAYFEIYIPEFVPIADWDFTRIVTDYANIEYDSNDSINFERPFIHNKNIKDTLIPHGESFENGYNINVNHLQFVPAYNYFIGPYTDLLFDGTSNYILPSASEYAVGGDLYILNKSNSLTRIWDLNQSVVKWGYANSINNVAYPYKLNNSLTVSGIWNLTPSLYDSNVNIHNMNLDWFYTPGAPYYILLGDGMGYTYTSYQHQLFQTHRSLNIDLIDTDIYGYVFAFDYSLNNKYKIKLDYYKNKNCVIDYFDFIFNQETNLNISEKNTYNTVQINKIAYFNTPDIINGPIIFFKGFNAYIRYTNLSNPNELSSYTNYAANDIVGYGFSILFDNIETNDDTKWGKAGIEIIMNKWYKNVLIYIYVYTPYGSLTNFHYAKRDDLYSKTNVQYILTDSLLGSSTWVNTELDVQSLTLSNFINIISTDILNPPHFSDGIKYTILEDIKQWNLYSSLTITTEQSINIFYNSTTNVTTLTLTMNSYLPFKHSDWIYIDNSGTLLDGKNYKINKKIGTNKITLDILGNIFNLTSLLYDLNITDLLLLTLPIPITSTNTNSLTISKQISIMPFKFVLIEPEKIQIDRSVNIISGDTSCPVLPHNNIKNYPDILMKTIHTSGNNTNINNGIVPYVYNNDIIARKLNKITKQNELTYTQIDNLPYIIRYSGDYEPILKEVDMFYKASTYMFYNSGVYTISTVINENNKFNIVITVDMVILNVIDAVYLNELLKPNDIIFFDYSSNETTPGYVTYPEFARQTAHVISSTHDLNNSISTIVTSIEVDINLYPTPIDLTVYPNTLDVINIYLFRIFKKNTTFSTSHFDFGKIKNNMIAKVYEDVNPLKTSKDIFKTSNKFPMIDEVGVTEIDRNIFKSSWDSVYYYKTDTNKYNTI